MKIAGAVYKPEKILQLDFPHKTPTIRRVLCPKNHSESRLGGRRKRKRSQQRSSDKSERSVHRLTPTQARSSVAEHRSPKPRTRVRFLPRLPVKKRVCPPGIVVFLHCAKHLEGLNPGSIRGTKKRKRPEPAEGHFLFVRRRHEGRSPKYSFRACHSQRKPLALSGFFSFLLKTEETHPAPPARIFFDF